MSNIVLEKFSHITYEKTREVFVIRKIKKGETYTPNEYNFKIKEDYIHKNSIIRALTNNNKCIAKEDRWYSGRGTVVKTIYDVIADWNNNVFYDKETDKWYYRPYLEICLLDGGKMKMFFNNDDALMKELKLLTTNMEHDIVLDCLD